MAVDDWEDYLARLYEAGHGAWLGSTDDDAVDLFSYYGLGIMLNSAQSDSCRDLLTWGPGTGHVWRFANRVGKTTALDVVHAFAAFRKWRPGWEPVASDWQTWKGVPYKTLHSAPENRLMGKAWDLFKLIIEGRSDPQVNKLTGRTRPALLAPLFSAGTGTNPDGSDAVWVRCVNGSQIDFLSTHDGAGRMESDNWYLLSWDEFIRHKPIEDVTTIIDQTILPRSSDYLAPFILSSTSTEDGDWVYDEIEEHAKQAPRYWNFKTYGRSANFAATQASIDRQIEMSFNREVADRSVGGTLGEGGVGPFPKFVLDNAFLADLPERTLKIRDGWQTYQGFDHGIANDASVVLSVAGSWPPRADDWLKDPAVGVGLSMLKSRRSLLPAELVAWAVREHKAFDAAWMGIDATAEGGQIIYRDAGAQGVRAIPYNFTERTMGSNRIGLKEWGIQSLQWMLGYGLPDFDVPTEGWVTEWPDPQGRPFGLLRFPKTGQWLRLHRQLLTLKRDDAKLTQDFAMAAIILAGILRRSLDAGRTNRTQPWNPLRQRRMIPTRTR